MTYITLNRLATTPLYLQLYTYFLQEITTGKLKPHSKMPSIRNLAKNLNLSKTTVQNAYDQLVAEGYIVNHRRSHYAVCEVLQDNIFPVIAEPANSPAHTNILYDFSSGDIPQNAFNFSIWRKYINFFLKSPTLFFNASYNAGEATLRAQLATYLKQSRGINAHPDQLVIGAGIQPLLLIICQLLQPNFSAITFEKPGFMLAQAAFKNLGFNLNFIDAIKESAIHKKLPTTSGNLIYTTPSNQFPTGFIMPINQRLELLKWANSYNNYIIEDDYESEFKYYGKPIPALKALDQADNVIYLGSLSKIIPATIRISYLLLPETLLAIYNKNCNQFKQTASTLEQLALAKFIENGDFHRQIRRLRKLYAEKSVVFFSILQKIFKDKISFEKKYHGINALINVKTNYTAQQLTDLALQSNCKVQVISDSSSTFPTVLLYFNKIENNDLEVALAKLYQAWFS